ncbi:MAG: MATE family efflux transporter [Proteobacteria bacterium]|nr:MATE family efflux transporter [Pseudomonadota bacterium]
MTQTMTYGGHAKAVLILGLPLIGSHIAQMAIGMTDTVMMGWYGVPDLAAMVLASSMFFLLLIVGSGFAFAVMPMVANAVGAGDDMQVRRVTRMGLWASALYAVLALPLMWWSKAILLALGQEPVVAGLAQDYLRITGFGLFPSLFVMVIKSYLAALERAQIVLWVTVAGAILNGVLNYALIFGHWGAPELGIRGAAIASVMMPLVSMPMLMIYIARNMPEHALFQRIWRFDPAAFGRVFRLGLPIGLTNLSETALFSATAIMMGWVGTLELAAHGIALQWTAVAFMVHVGLSNAATVRAGRAVGRADAAGLRRGGIATLVLALTLSCVAVLLFLSLPEQMISVFLDDAEPARDQIISIGVGLLAMAALFHVADSTQVVALGLLRGVQDVRVPLIMAVISYWVVGIPAGYLFGFVWGYGAVGIWMGLVCGLTLAAVLLNYRFWTINWIKS